MQSVGSAGTHRWPDAGAGRAWAQGTAGICFGSLPGAHQSSVGLHCFWVLPKGQFSFLVLQTQGHIPVMSSLRSGFDTHKVRRAGHCERASGWLRDLRPGSPGEPKGPFSSAAEQRTEEQTWTDTTPMGRARSSGACAGREGPRCFRIVRFVRIDQARWGHGCATLDGKALGCFWWSMWFRQLESGRCTPWVAAH